MSNARTPAETRLHGSDAELAAALAKLARAHAHDVIAESSKLASAVRMGRLLAYEVPQLMKVAAPAGAALSMAGKAVHGLLPAAERGAGQIARAGTHFVPAGAVSRAGALGGEAQQLLGMAQKLEGAGHHTGDISFLRNRAQQLMEGKALPQGGASHQQLMSAFEQRLGEIGNKPVPRTTVPQTAISHPPTPTGGGRSLPPSPGQAPAGGVTAAMHEPEAMYAGTMGAPAAKSNVGAVKPTTNADVRAMSTQELEAVPIKPSREAVPREGLGERSTMQIERPAPAPATAAPPVTTGAAPQPQPAGGLTTRDIALGGVGIGGAGFGGGALMHRQQQQPQPQGMPPLPPGYPQMTVTASAMPSMVTILKQAGMFANMGEAVAGWGSKAMKAAKAPVVQQTVQEGAKKGMGWGTPLKVMGIGAGIGAAGAGVGAGALGVGHAVNQHRQFGSTSYMPQGPRSYMYSNQM